MRFFHELFQKAVLAFRRFPFCMLWAVAGSIYFLIAIGNDVPLFADNFRWDMIFVLGISWLIGTAFFVEQFEKPQRYWWVHLLTLLLLGLYCWSLPETDKQANIAVHTRWWLLLLAGHVFVFFAPFVKSWDDVAFWNYLKNILIALGRSILFSTVLYGGLALALVASVTLFSLEISGNIYGQLFVICLGIVNTCIYLSDFPKDVQRNRTFVFNKALAVFVKFILLPLLLLYFFILYLYGFKILFSWELPQGWLSALICSLAIIGFIVQIMIDPWEEKSSVLIRRFHPWFYVLMIPILVLLFVAVFRRIGDYNFTETRYLLMMLSFWILGTCLYLICSKTPKMRFLPISLFILILLSSFGPWGAFGISLNSQINEFKQIHRHIITGDRKIEREKAERFQSIVYYFERRNELDQLGPILGFDPTFDDTFRWNTAWKILDSLDIEILPAENLGGSGDHYFHFYRNQPVYFQGEDFSSFAELHWPEHMIEDSIGRVYRMKWENAEMDVYREEHLLFSLSLDSVLRANAISNYNLLQESPDRLEFKIMNLDHRYKLMFTRLTYLARDDSIIINDADAYLFFASRVGE